MLGFLRDLGRAAGADGLYREKPSPAYRGWHGVSRDGCGGDPVRFFGLPGKSIGPTSVSPDGLPPSPQGEGFSLKPRPLPPLIRHGLRHDTFPQGKAYASPVLRIEFVRIGACRRPYKRNRGCVPPLIRHGLRHATFPQGKAISPPHGACNFVPHLSKRKENLL